MPSSKNDVRRVSVHGGHSGKFCNHAQDSLADVVGQYAAAGFEWICLTEHMPPAAPEFVLPEETAAGFDVESLHQRFDEYMAEARRLQHTWRDTLTIFTGFETEAWDGYEDAVAALIDRHQPDLLVGSVHHVFGILFDGGPDFYAEAVRRAGGIEALYCAYFDRQLELINEFHPAVVGHFDLIRLHDPDYRLRWQDPAIEARARRNLLRISELGLTLDLNLRAFNKGASEPYVSKPWLDLALQLGISVVPGDDAHGVADVGKHYDRGVAALVAAGGSTNWQRPTLR